AITVTDIRGARRSASALPIPLEAPTTSACPERSPISGRERRSSLGDQIVRGLRLPDAVEIGVGTDLLEQVDDGKDRKRIPLARLTEVLPALQRLIALERVRQLLQKFIDCHCLSSPMKVGGANMRSVSITQAPQLRPIPKPANSEVRREFW